MKPYRWTDEHGAEHVYRSFLNRHCDAHGRVCSPWTPVTTEQVLTMAANDETLGDDTFTTLARTIDQQGD